MYQLLPVMDAIILRIDVVDTTVCQCTLEPYRLECYDKKYAPGNYCLCMRRFNGAHFSGILLLQPL